MNIPAYSFLLIICFFPTWLIKFKIFGQEAIILLAFLFFIFCLSILIITLLVKFKKYFLLNIFCSLIILFGLDNHLSLHRELTNSTTFLALKFGGIYYLSLLLLITIFFIIFIINHFLKDNGIKIFSIFTLTILVLSLINSNKSIDNIHDFEKEITLNDNRSAVVLLLDEMSGIGSFESQTEYGKKFDESLKNLAKKNDLILYSKIYSKFKSTLNSIGSFLNFSMKVDKKNLYETESKNFYYSNSLKKNKLFDNFKSISVYQSIHIDYCNHNNVMKCKGFNPFKKKSYLDGFKDNKFTILINAWKLDGSITALFVWRILRQFELIDVTLSPQGEKASFPSLLKNILIDIKSKKYDLIFAHTLVPHKPYGFNEKCQYDGKKSLGNYNSSLSIEKHTLYHNIDRTCTIKFIDRFLSNLKNQNTSYNTIYFLSDHGSRNIMTNPNSSLNSVFFIKDNFSNYLEIKNKKITQEEFKKRISNVFQK